MSGPGCLATCFSLYLSPLPIRWAKRKAACAGTERVGGVPGGLPCLIQAGHPSAAPQQPLCGRDSGATNARERDSNEMGERLLSFPVGDSLLGAHSGKTSAGSIPPLPRGQRAGHRSTDPLAIQRPPGGSFQSPKCRAQEGGKLSVLELLEFWVSTPEAQEASHQTSASLQRGLITLEAPGQVEGPEPPWGFL